MKISETTRSVRTVRAAATGRTAPVNGIKTQPAASVLEPAIVLGIPVHEVTPRVREALLTLMQEVESLRREIERNQSRMAELEKLADSDTLSPVANRRAFVRELLRVMSYAERYQVETSILFIDVNDLKTINDAHGHAAGDAALMHVADTLRANIRGSDMVGRLGGDEYAVILSHASEEQATQKADLLQHKISEKPVLFQGQSIVVAAAVGVYTFGPGETPTAVLAAADKRMYARKKKMKAATEKV